jgi:hypothetical protein
MRVLSVAVALLFVTGCSAGYQQIPVSEPIALRRRVDTSAAANEADRSRRAGAAHEDVTTYVAAHPERADMHEALLADQLAEGMNVREIALVFPRRSLGVRMAAAIDELAVAIEVDQGNDVVRFVEVRRDVFLGALGTISELEAKLVMRNDVVVAWSGSGKGGPTSRCGRKPSRP